MGDAGAIGQRLNPGSSGARGPSGSSAASSPDIRVDPDVLDRASGAAGEVHEGLNKDGRLADDSTTEAAASLGREGFKLGRALTGTGETWHSQVSTLLLACHKVDEALAATADGHRMVEANNEMTIAEIAKHFE